MDYQIFLIYIVLALIVAVTIQILFRTFYPSNKEKFSDISHVNGVNSNLTNMYSSVSNLGYETEVNKYNNNNNHNLKYLSDTDAGNTIPNNLMSEESQALCDSVDGSTNRTPHLIESTTCIADEPNINTYADNTYEKEFGKDNGNCVCPAPAIPSSREDLHTYRNKFVDFRSHLYQSSAGVDPVDRMNDKLYSGNGSYDVQGSKCGEKISDAYDYLTGGRNGEKKCDSQYKMSGTLGDYYTRDNWVYNCDHVMNGAIFYNDVTGLDPLMDNQMAINQ